MKQSRLLPGKTGFTLTELLVVIAIIGILSVLVIPAVGLVRNKANNSKSISNLRQFGAAYAAFQGDNGGKMPPAGAESDEPFGWGANNKGWDYFLLPYLGFEDTGYGHGDNPMPRAEELFMHPSDNNSNPQEGYRRTYAANQFATPIGDENTGWTTIYQISANKDISRLILLTERPYGQGTIGGRSFSEATPQLQLRDIDGEELNGGSLFHYLFVDGHVEALNWEDTVPTGYSVSDKAGKRYSGTSQYNLWGEDAN